jgi:hypothetical protein
MSFANVAAFSAAANDKNWISSYRKALSASATVAGQWYDYSYAGGNPIPNYYASSPLEAAVLEYEKGIICPRVTDKLFLHRWTVMTAAASTASVTNANQALVMMDYVLFYPFVDMDAAGEDQAMTQTVSLPRYESGVGLEMMVVAQSPTVGGGLFTITFTDSNDVQFVTESLFCAAAQPAGALVQAVGAAAGVQAFVPKPAGANGVKRVDSVNFSVANGGLCAVVLVKPLQSMYLREECRQTSADSFGDAAEQEAMRTRAGIVEIKDGAFIGIIGQAANGSLASSVLVGTLETVWN